MHIRLTVQNPRVLVKPRVEEAKSRLSSGYSGTIEQGDDGSEGRRGCGRAGEMIILALDWQGIPRAISTDVGEHADLLRVVVLSGRVRRCVLGIGGSHRSLLIRRNREIVGSTTAGIDNLVGCAFGVSNVLACRNLGSSNTGHVCASAGEPVRAGKDRWREQEICGDGVAENLSGLTKD